MPYKIAILDLLQNKNIILKESTILGSREPNFVDFFYLSIMEKLISMTKFVKEYYSDESRDELQTLDLFDNYATFLLRPLTLGMFVPCDENGNVLKEPAYFTEWENDEEFIFSIEGVGKECVEFNNAKEKVLFKGFELMKDSRFKTIVWIKDKDIQFSININLQSNIENIISSKLELTESAIKQIFGKP